MVDGGPEEADEEQQAPAARPEPVGAGAGDEPEAPGTAETLLPPDGPRPGSPRRRRILIAGIAAVVLLGAAGLTWALTRDDGGGGTSAARAAAVRHHHRKAVAATTTTTTVAPGSATTVTPPPSTVAGPAPAPAGAPDTTTLPIAQGISVAEGPGACSYDAGAQELQDAGTFTNHSGDTQTVTIDVSYLGPDGAELATDSYLDSIDDGQTLTWSVSTPWVSDGDDPDAPPPPVHCALQVS